MAGAAAGLEAPGRGAAQAGTATLTGGTAAATAAEWAATMSFRSQRIKTQGAADVPVLLLCRQALAAALHNKVAIKEEI